MTKQTRRSRRLVISVAVLLFFICSGVLLAGFVIDLQILYSLAAEPVLTFLQIDTGQVDNLGLPGWLFPFVASPVVTTLLTLPFRIVFVIFIFLVAFLVHRLAWTIAGWMLNSKVWHSLFVWSTRPIEATLLHKKVPNPTMRVERQRTIQLLFASVISITAFTTAVMVSLAQFMSSGALAVVTGLFTAAFGFGARTLIGDLLAGISNIFEDHFDVGEKVEISHFPTMVEGVVESVNVRTTSVRAPTGELLVIPNGEIRVLRNFSRGRFSAAHIKLKIEATDLDKALHILESLGQEAVSILPNLLEPWQTISEEGAIGEHVELVLLAKAKFGQAAALRPNLLALVQKKLKEVDITLAD
jgi:small-conductance mechanosensitive channel